MRKNMKKLTVATVIGAMTVTALAPVSAQAKDKTLTVAIWDNGQKAGLQEIMDEFTKETGIKTESGAATGHFLKQVHQAETCRTYSGCIPMKL